MRFTPIALLAATVLLAVPPALAYHWDRSGSADCALFGATACHLELTLSPAVMSCNTAGCTFSIACYGRIGGFVSAGADGTCNGIPWFAPCGSGCYYSFSADGGTFFAPRGCTEANNVHATGTAHGMVVDQTTPPIHLVSPLCV